MDYSILYADCFLLPRDSYTLFLGRLGSNDIIVPDEHISAKHLSFSLNSDSKGIIVSVIGRNGAVIDGDYYEAGKSIKVLFGVTINVCSVWMCICRYHIFIKADKGFKARLIRIKPNNLYKRSGFSLNNKVFIPALRVCPVYDYTPIELDLPPSRKNPDLQPIFLVAGPALTMVIPILLGSGRKIMIIAGVISAIWASLNVIFRRKRNKAEERKRRKAYSGYVLECEEVIKNRYKDIKNTMIASYPELEVYLLGGGNVHLMWNRNELYEDYGYLRCGIGQLDFPVEIKFQKEKFSVVEDSLRALPRQLKDKWKYLKDVPVVFDLTKKQYFAISTSEVKTSWEIAFSLILQMSVIFRPTQLRLSVISGYLSNVQSLGLLPHTYHLGQSLVCTGKNTDIEFLNNNMTEMVCVFTDNKDVLDKLLVNERLIVFYVTDKFEDIPSNFDTVLFSSDAFTGIINGSNVWSKRTQVKFDQCGLYELDYFSPLISRLSDHVVKMIKPIPEKVLLSEILSGSSNYDLLSSRGISDSWDKASEREDLNVPIGVGIDGRIVNLDIDESSHGPHGLIAGMTGSGKSELLKTFILSLSSIYSPDDVNFFLIDYKGGGMANDFALLPHVCGMISNLSGTLIERAMASIKSEIRYRQEMFLQYGVSSIKEYRKKAKMPHVVIIIDEFAELKREEPDFMAKLVSVAQVGRSLGVHLILATQKPSGCVDDKIWSNSRFRICLKVRDKADSNDMLHKADAAYITNAGRAYLQVGNDELYEEFQCAYTMAGLDKKEAKDNIRIYDEEFKLVRDNEALITRVIEDNHSSKTIHEHLLWCINEAYTLSGYSPVRRLWLDELSEIIVSEDEGELSDGNIIIGLYDDPDNQKQDKLCYDIDACGNTAIFGNVQCGKSTLIMRILAEIIRLSSPSILNLYILDFGGTRLRVFEESYICGGYIGIEHSHRIDKLIYYLKDVIAMRQKHQETRPHILVVIDNYRGMLDYCSEALESELLWMLRNGVSVGVSFLISAAGIGGLDLPQRASNLIDTVIPLSLKDKYTYSMCLNVQNHMIPAIDSCPGRGVYKIGKRVLQFQTFTPVPSENEDEWEDIIRTRIRNRNKTFDSKASPYPYIPSKPDLRCLYEASAHLKDDKLLPIGYIEKTGRLYCLKLRDFSCLLILGRVRSGRKNTLRVIEYMAKSRDISTYHINQISDFSELINNQSKGIVIITDLEAALLSFYSNSYDENIERELADYFRKSNEMPADNHLKLCAVINNKTNTALIGKRLWREISAHPLGIALGGSYDEQNLFDFSFMGYSNIIKKLPKGRGCVAYYDEDCFCGDIVIPKGDADEDNCNNNCWNE